MTDLKNICLAGFASTTSIFAAIEAQTLITIISAIVLPIFFFCIGKAVDVLVQMRLGQKKIPRTIFKQDVQDEQDGRPD